MRLGFENYLEMAKYMKSKGFEWSEEVGNYIPASPATQKKEENVASGTGRINVSINSNGIVGFEQFLPLLEWLSSNKDRLQSLLGASGASGQIPRFTLPSTFVTKSVHMTNTLDLMDRDFSNEKNINQREIFEVVLIEFFQKYRYTHGVETLLQKNA